MAIQKQTKNRLWIGIGLIVFLALLMVFVFSGDNYDLLKSVFSDDLSNEELRDKLSEFGWRGYITVVVLALLQVICVVLPAEPVQVLGGLTFGFPIGLLCCWIGVFLGNTAIYLLQKTFGDKLRGFFIKRLGLDLEKIAQSSKCILIIFILYFLPAIPYGMICFFAASIGMSYRRYITITMLGSLPSVCIGVGLGYMAIASNWIVSVCVFGVLLILLAVMMLKKDALFSKLNNFAEKNKVSPRCDVQKVNGFLLAILYVVVRSYFWLKGVHVKPSKKVQKVEKPAIVLCNHGSFVDFLFAETLLKKYQPNYVVARLYFYNKYLRWLLKKLGCFPKSMFALDMESTKNCLKVLKEGGCLTMMPEARLSTAGRFEDIQDSTYSFIKKSGVSVYTVKFCGDYFANPKWGKGFRRGSMVEAELDILYTAEQVKALSVDEIKAGIEQRLYYDEFEWIKERPQYHYRSKRMAEGLENILTLCPVCGKKHSLTTKKDKVFCGNCGYLTSIDDRYNFSEDFRFRNLSQWYDWQKEQMAKAIEEDPQYALESEVELRLPGDGNGLTRPAGQGVCRLDRQGLTYCGTKDGETIERLFPMEQIYRLLFGAGENFEIYNATEIWYFVPKERRSAVDWYTASIILRDEEKQG